MLTEKSKNFLKKYQAGGTLLPAQSLPQGLQSITQLDIQNQALQQAVTPNNALQSFRANPQIDLGMQNTENPNGIGGAIANSASAIPVIGSAVSAFYGAYQIGQSIKEKKRQKKLKGYYDQDLKERKRDIRLNEYVNTPYSFQVGGNFNQNQTDYNNEIQRQWEEYYGDLNNQNIQKYKNLQQQGVQSTTKGITDHFNQALQMVSLQQGGQVEEDKTDIYSENFDPNVFLGTEAAIQQDTIKQDDELMKWIFEDTDDYSPIQQEYEEYSQAQSQDFHDSIIENIGQSESGGNYGVINPTTGTTGKYQFHPKYWADQIGDFMGISGSKEQIMEEFKNSPQTQEDFMEHVVNNIYKPEIKKLQPYIDKYGFNEEQMIRFLHYRGVGDTKRRLMSGDFEVSQSEKEKYKNPSILEYISQ